MATFNLYTAKQLTYKKWSQSDSIKYLGVIIDNKLSWKL